jgi:hypothetical protein
MMSQERQWVMLDPTNGASSEAEAEDVATPAVPVAATVASASPPIAESSTD